MPSLELEAARIYDTLAASVLRYFRGHGIADAEDLTGDVFVSATAGLGRFRGDDAALRRWVFTIAHHRLVDYYRRNGRRLDWPTGELPDTACVDLSEADIELARALQMLTAQRREVIVLRFIADLPLEEVASVMRNG